MMRWALASVHPYGFWTGSVWARRRHSRGVPTSFPFSSLQFVIASKTFQSPRLVNFTLTFFAVYILLKLWRFDSIEEGFRNFYQSQGQTKSKKWDQLLSTDTVTSHGRTAPTC